MQQVASPFPPADPFHDQPVSGAPSLSPAGRPQPDGFVLLFFAVVATAMAAGMGWGIRGQFGHESGAMIAGTLAAFTLVLLFVPHTTSLRAARAAAWMAVAIGIGGSMTYGQTIGLTHDHEIHEINHNWEALRWGMLGLFTKGGIWIGFGGLLLGMGLGGKRYQWFEMTLVMLGVLAVMVLGIWLINSPFDPANKILPTIYFSDDWYFEPGRDLKPRPEVWGGFLLALVSLACYARFARHDRLAGRMAIVGFIAGGIGFPCGQTLQSMHQLSPEIFSEDGTLGFISGFTRHFNWWNIMETTFGMVWGAIMGLGLWLNRHLIAIDESSEEVTITPSWELFLFLVHLILVLTGEFLKLPGWEVQREFYIEYGPLMATIPLIAILGGRFWPYLMLFPMVAAPIVGKALRARVYQGDAMEPGFGWLFLVAIPMAVMVMAAIWFIVRSERGQSARSFAAIGLVITSWFYFGVNSVVFDFAWPWKDFIEWTGRTPNQLIFGVCTIGLTITAVVFAWPRRSLKI